MTIEYLNKIENKLLSQHIVENNKYFKKYLRILKNNINRKRNEGGWTQEHHCFPKHISEFLKESVNNNEENLIHLLYLDHLKAHIYLSLSYLNNELFLRSIWIFQIIFFNKYNRDINKKFSKDELIQILQEDLIKLKNKRFKIQLEIDKKYYDRANEILDNGGSFGDVAKKLGKTRLYHKCRYREICIKYNWKTHNFRNEKIYWNKEKAKRFYIIVSKMLKLRYSWTVINRVFKHSNNAGAIKQKYIHVCKKYNWEKIKINSPEFGGGEKGDKLYYNECNKLFKKGLLPIQIDKLKNKTKGYTADRYHYICDKYGWKRMFQHKRTIEQDKTWYDSANNWFKTHLTINGFENKKYNTNYAQYCRVCKRNGWKNQIKKRR